MKIRSHLLLLVAAALVPLLVFSAALTAYSWWEQRRGVEVRQLERVRALTIALDTELQSSVRVMRVLGSEQSIVGRDKEAFLRRIRDVMASQPLWSSFAVGDAAWQSPLAVAAVGQQPTTVIDSATLAKALASGQPAVSGVLREGDRLLTQIIVPVAGDGPATVIMVAIDHRRWLAFMSQYPIGNGAIMTLLDQDGIIIARTLNDEGWAGKPATPAMVEQVRRTVEANFRHVTLEGDPMFAAHSRSVRWGWTLATGIPVSVVESSLFESTLMLVGAALASVGLALLMAFLFGRRITLPMDRLGAAAHAMAHGSTPPEVDPHGIREVRDVAGAFRYAGQALLERERALNEALEREQRARRQAEDASQAKDEFLAMLGHELRNPLNAVTGAAAVMQQVAPDSPQAARARDIVSRQVITLRELVDDLLDMARVSSGKIALNLKTVDLAQVARHAVSVLTASGRLAEHHLEIDASPTWVLGDETRLEQVVTNLLDNAAKYTPKGGRIRLAVSSQEGHGVVEVSDSGMGIPPELLPRIFELFTQGERTLDRSQGGLGLGLALVRRLVEMHGGQVAAASEGAGQGACFRVSLPLTDAPPSIAPPVAAAPQDQERKLRILIVEDNPDGRETLALMLGMEGHEVHAAEDGPSGVKEALEWTPDAAIVDIGLPGFDGYEVARRIRAKAKGLAIRLVALTGYGQEEDRRAAMAAGFDSFLVKPADFKAINNILATV